MKVLQPADHTRLIEVLKEFDEKLAKYPEGSVTLIITGRKCEIKGTRFEIDRAWKPA